MRLAAVAIAAAMLVSLTGAVPAQGQDAPAPVTHCDVPILMSDGAEMRGHVTHPGADGRYPVVLEITGYNKGSGDYGGRCGVSRADLVERGYATMVVDDRGTGASEGKWDRYGPRTRQDYGEILDWIQAQPWSNGRVGVTGTSYSAGTAFMTAIEDGKRMAQGKPRAVHAVWANVPMSDMYRDYPHVGGFVNNGFTAPWLGLVAASSAPPPSTFGDEPDAPRTWLGRWTNLKDMQVPLTAGALAGGERAYDDEDFYRSHSPGNGAELITAPVAWTGGWFDIFQRGAVDWWHLLRNAPVKKMWMQPIYHIGGENVFSEQGIGTQGEVLDAWWDRWLKDEKNGVDRLPDVNLWRMGERSWYHGRDWPAPEYTRYYLSDGTSGSASSLHDGVLSTAPPEKAGRDVMPFNAAAGACTRSTAQWSGGFVGGLASPQCVNDNRSDEVNALTYTTEPLDSDVEVTGMITADLWASVSAKDTAFVVRLLDVAPDGTSTQVAGGWLIGRHRAVDESKSLYARGGRGMKGQVLIRPFHPFTQEAEKLLQPNLPTNFKIEVYPTSNVFQKGHRIRMAITTSDSSSMAIPEPWLAQMVDGEVELIRSAQYPSHIQLPVIPRASSSQRPARVR